MDYGFARFDVDGDEMTVRFILTDSGEVSVEGGELVISISSGTRGCKGHAANV